jgi:hypothetical protein|tara:strand:+ start:1291 stop:1473 length:183 start_codon:yes stop_codon:yes gene_type:complete
MPSLAELQEVSPLFFQLLFFVVAGALLVGTFVAIVRLMFKYAIAIILIICAFFLYNVYFL